jgi:hypothetical protein
VKSKCQHYHHNHPRAAREHQVTTSRHFRRLSSGSLRNTRRYSPR